MEIDKWLVGVINSFTARARGRKGTQGYPRVPLRPRAFAVKTTS